MGLRTITYARGANRRPRRNGPWSPLQGGTSRPRGVLSLNLKRMTMGAISVLIGVLIILIVGAICFWAIDRSATDGRLANLLKLLVVLVVWARLSSVC